MFKAVGYLNKTILYESLNVCLSLPLFAKYFQELLKTGIVVKQWLCRYASEKEARVWRLQEAWYFVMESC